MIDLENIEEAIPNAIINLRYLTIDNFTKRILYSSGYTARLDPRALVALNKAAEAFKSLGFRIVIWDSYRLPEVQEQLIKIINDERYVRKNSLHTKGLAVDITLADKKGNCLEMGTDFDDFTEKAHSITTNISADAKINRKMLAKIMTDAGFKQWFYEWWHFDYLIDAT